MWSLSPLLPSSQGSQSCTVCCPVPETVASKVCPGTIIAYVFFSIWARCRAILALLQLKHRELTTPQAWLYTQGYFTFVESFLKLLRISSALFTRIMGAGESFVQTSNPSLICLRLCKFSYVFISLFSFICGMVICWNSFGVRKRNIDMRRSGFKFQRSPNDCAWLRLCIKWSKNTSFSGSLSGCWENFWDSCYFLSVVVQETTQI